MINFMLTMIMKHIMITMIMNNKELIDKEDKLHYNFIKNLYNSNLSSYKQELLLNKFR